MIKEQFYTKLAKIKDNASGKLSKAKKEEILKEILFLINEVPNYYISDHLLNHYHQNAEKKVTDLIESFEGLKDNNFWGF